MLRHRQVLSHQQDILVGHALRALSGSACTSSSSLSADAQSRLLEHWRDFDATKLSRAQLEALQVMAFRPGAAKSAEEVAQQFQSQFEKVADDRKSMLVQKVAAFAGLHPMAPLLAWSSASIKHHLQSSLLPALTEAANSGQGTAPVFVRDLLSLARASGFSKPGVSDTDALSAYLSSASTLSWQELLSMPHLPYLLSEVSASDAMLGSMLQLLGMFQVQAVPPHILQVAPPPLQPLEIELHELSRASQAKLSREGAAAVPKSELVQSAISLRLCRFVEASLGLDLSTSSLPSAPHAHLLLHLLRVPRPFHKQPTPPTQPKQQQQQQQQTQPAESSSSSNSESRGGEHNSVPRASNSSSGGAHEHGVGASANQHAHRGADSHGFAVSTPVVLQMEGGAGKLLEAVAAQFAQSIGEGGVVHKLLAARHSEVDAALHRLSQKQGPASALLKQLQALRKQLLLSGDVPVLATATASDLAALSPQEFWQLYGASRRADVVGATLARSLLQPSQILNRGTTTTTTTTSSKKASPTHTQPPDLDMVWSLPDSDRAALAWVLLRGSQSPDHRFPSLTHTSSTSMPSPSSPPSSASSSTASAPGSQTSPSSSSSSSSGKSEGQRHGGSSSGSSNKLPAERAARALYKGFEARAVAAYRDRVTAAQAAADLARAAQLEYDLSEINYVDEGQPPLLSLLSSQEGGLPDPQSLLPIPQLPAPEQVAQARASLPASQLLLFDLLGEEMAGGGASAVQVQLAFEALGKEVQSRPNEELQQLPPSFTTWAMEAKQKLLGLHPTALALLSRFIEMRLARSREDASVDAARLRVLLREVAGAVERADRLQRAESPSTSQPDIGAASSSSTINPYWASADPPRSGRAERTASNDPYKRMLPSPEDVRALLGGGGTGFGSAEGEAAEFEAWLRSEALLGAEQGAMQRKQEGKPQPYELLAAQHLDQDIERYLTMEHDPQLHLCFEGAAPRPWRDPEGVSVNEEVFLESMRPLLDRYLQARGMRPLLDSEWQVYADAALTEWGATRSMHEEALRAVGQSAFFNSRAESIYLRQLVASGIPAGAPLAEQAQRYMQVLEHNPSWTFAQRKHAAKRLIELSAHFARQPPPSERGSPFAPLFSPSTVSKDEKASQHLVAPALGRISKGDVHAETPLPQGW